MKILLYVVPGLAMVLLLALDIQHKSSQSLLVSDGVIHLKNGWVEVSRQKCIILFGRGRRSQFL